MGTRRIADDERGRPRAIRLRFRPEDYTVPPGYLEQLRQDYRDYGTRELVSSYDGPWRGFNRRGEHERDGKQFVILVSVREWAIEVELTDTKLGELRALTPDEAWALARRFDLTLDPPVELEEETEEET